MKETQVFRLVAYLREHPGATGLQIIDALSMPKYTSRISDARAQGIDIVCRKVDGVNGYVVKDRPTTADLRGLAPGITGGLSSEDYVRSIRDEHQHDWKDAPDWHAEPGTKAQECFACRGLRYLAVETPPVTQGETVALPW